LLNSLRGDRSVLQKDLSNEDGFPKRKTRRVRDPYAIDFSDEEDEDGMDEPKEESLADFLRSSAPPMDNGPSSVFESATSSVFDSVPKPKKKSSFFGRSGLLIPPQKSTSPNTSNPPRLSAPSHSPISTNLNNSGNYVSQLDSARNPSITSLTKVAQKTYQPREPQPGSTRTGDLADFLRNSEPPPGSQPRALSASISEEKESSNFASRMFGRRKKVSGY